MDDQRQSGIALVTGAGTGVGRAAAEALNAAGWHVVLVGRHVETLQETAELCAAPDRCTVLPADIADPAAVDALFADIRSALGRLDLLFNNAGQNAPGVPLEELTYDQWRMVIDVNLTGTFLCTQAAFRLMKDQDPMGGRIINNGSISAHVPRPDSIPYTATKHAVTGMTKTAGLDGRKYNIAVGQLDIGNAATPMTRRMQKGVKQADGSLKTEPTIDVAEVGRAVAYMASLPLDANIQTMTVMATQMPFVGRG